jgi:hypothetical protein
VWAIAIGGTIIGIFGETELLQSFTDRLEEKCEGAMLFPP